MPSGDGSGPPCWGRGRRNRGGSRLFPGNQGIGNILWTLGAAATTEMMRPNSWLRRLVAGTVSRLLSSQPADRGEQGRITAKYTEEISEGK